MDGGGTVWVLFGYVSHFLDVGWFVLRLLCCGVMFGITVTVGEGMLQGWCSPCWNYCVHFSSGLGISYKCCV